MRDLSSRLMSSRYKVYEETEEIRLIKMSSRVTEVDLLIESDGVI